MSHNQTHKLQKILAMQGLGSRRTMETWILQGRVSVDGQTAELGCRVDDSAVISIDGKLIPALTPVSSDTQILMYHKPIGEICTQSDPEKRRTVFESLPNPTSGRWVVVGRLDLNTTGLLLFTNSGECANRLMHPSFHLEREYKVRVSDRVTEQQLSALRKGVMLEDGMAYFTKITLITVGQRQNTWLRVSITQGRHRIVRRLLASQGLTVNQLIRIRFGSLVMPDTLKPGEYQFVSLDAIVPSDKKL